MKEVYHYENRAIAHIVMNFVNFGQRPVICTHHGVHFPIFDTGRRRAAFFRCNNERWSLWRINWSDNSRQQHAINLFANNLIMRRWHSSCVQLNRILWRQFKPMSDYHSLWSQILKRICNDFWDGFWRSSWLLWNLRIQVRDFLVHQLVFISTFYILYRFNQHQDQLSYRVLYLLFIFFSTIWCELIFRSPTIFPFVLIT